MKKLIAVLLISVAASVASAQSFNGLAATTATLRAVSDVTGTDSFSTATLPQNAKAVIMNIDILIDANEIKRGAAVQVAPVGGGNLNSSLTDYTTRLYDLSKSDNFTSAAAISVKKRLVIPRDEFGAYNTFGVRVKGVGVTATDGAVGVSYQIAY